MIEVCNKDTRLGYHSEAESFKFFSSQIEKRISSLKTLLETEFEGKKDVLFCLCTETTPFRLNTSLHFSKGEMRVSHYYEGLSPKREKEELGKYDMQFEYNDKTDFGKYKITVKKDAIGWSEKYPLRAKISANGYSWIDVPDAKYTLGISKVAKEFAIFEK